MTYTFTIYLASVIILFILFTIYKIETRNIYTCKFTCEYTLKDLIIDVTILLCIGIPVLNTILAAAALLIIACTIIVQFLEWSKNIVIWGKK